MLSPNVANSTWYDPWGVRTSDEMYDRDIALIVVDCETNTRNQGEDAIGSMYASPHHPSNRIFAMGESLCTRGGWTQPVASNVRDNEDTLQDYFEELPGTQHTILVGHNFKFDLTYMIKEFVIRNTHYNDEPRDAVSYLNEWLFQTSVWDTMVVHYMLTGQQDKVISLENCAAYNKIPFKKDARLKQYWEEGIDTADIPWEELEPYLLGDIVTARKIYEKQYNMAKRLGMIELIYEQMELLKALALMEYYGMKVDVDNLIRDMTTVMDECNSLEEAIYAQVPEWVNIDSPKLLGVWLYGGEYPTVVDEAVLDKDGLPCYYKSGLKKGLLKTRKVTKYIKHVSTLPVFILMDKKGELNTSEDTLRDLCQNRKVPADTRNVLHLLLKYRELSKEYKTYYVGVGNLVWPHDDCIHGSLNQAVTATGRLSSSSPNLQNMPGYTED